MGGEWERRSIVVVKHKQTKSNNQSSEDHMTPRLWVKWKCLCWGASHSEEGTLAPPPIAADET